MSVEKDVVRARIDKTLKKQAHEILESLGLTVSDFIRIALTKVVNERGLPFEMYISNEEQPETFKKSDKGEDIYRAKDTEDLFRHLDI
ncbi:type II toxin-antitoxin system RelB/DinJ family antitoxin [Bartonella florencae]|uniref:type II toxin-antitoxin system RelB/DinJ family antitoxin n=1 Tax=Bartonella florencae TaxID=928210 RepID=UPI0002FDEA19|nr:type II toxin-antitoxin system RelB/DinJ family antitoxin [Bartonella florencae]